MTRRGHAMPALQIRDRLLARLDAVEEIADMLLDLCPSIARLIDDRFRPKLGRSGFWDTGGPAHRMSTGELRHGVLRWHPAICRHSEAVAGDREAAARAKKLQRRRAHRPLARFAVRP